MKSSYSLTVGFQLRKDTYSKKIGFIIPSLEKTNKNFANWIDKKNSC